MSSSKIQTLGMLVVQELRECKHSQSKGETDGDIAEDEFQGTASIEGCSSWRAKKGEAE